MSSAPSSSRPSAKPAFDLDYSIHDFEADPYPDSQYLYRRIEEAMVAEGTQRGGRTLDVACGVGKLAIEVTARGGEGWGLEPSKEMLGLGRYLYAQGRAVLVRGVAETLPFRDACFDRIICQGALGHFVAPPDFMREAARVVRPDGRVIIALANYESLSCKLGRGVRTISQRVARRPASPHRAYWEMPLDHYHRGELAFVRALGGACLQLERCYGISLLWLLRGSDAWTWGKTLERLPRPLASTFLVALDQLAHYTPALADMIISVWRPRRDAR